MKLSDKITLLKVKMNATYSSFANTLISNTWGTNVLTNDYANAIITALRLMGKEAPIWKKSILIPIEDEKRYYATYISHYTKDLIDYVGTTQLAFIFYDTSNSGYTLGELGAVPYEAIERNQYIDAYYWAQKLYGDHFALKSSSLLTTGITGSLNYIKTAPSVEYTLPCDSSVTSGRYIYNLEFGEKLQNWYTKATTTGTSPTVEDTILADGWALNDKLWVANGMQSFMILTFTAIPQYTYFQVSTDTTGTTEIPVMNQFLDDIDDIAMNYLYSILIDRNPDIAKTYSAKVNLKLIRTNDDVIKDIKKRASTMEPAIVDCYNYKGQRYGR